MKTILRECRVTLNSAAHSTEVSQQRKLARVVTAHMIRAEPFVLASTVKPESNKSNVFVSFLSFALQNMQPTHDCRARARWPACASGPACSPVTSFMQQTPSQRADARATNIVAPLQRTALHRCNSRAFLLSPVGAGGGSATLASVVLPMAVRRCHRR